MKRALAASEAVKSTGEDKKMKKSRVEEGERGSGFVNLDENLVYEMLKHVDARTLAATLCVSKLWHRTTQDERFWELICTRHGANIGCANQQLRSPSFSSASSSSSS